MVPHVLTHGMTVGTLGLGTRAKRVLASAGIVTIAQLVSRLDDLSATGGMGRRALGQVAYELRSRALQCGGGVPNCRGCLHVGALFASGPSSPPQSQLAKLRWWNRLPLPLVQPAVRRLPPLLYQPSTLSLGRAVCPPLAKGCACTQDLAERVRIAIEKEEDVRMSLQLNNAIHKRTMLPSTADAKGLRAVVKYTESALVWRGRRHRCGSTYQRSICIALPWN